MQVPHRESGYIVLLCLTESGYFNADISKRLGTFVQISQRHWVLYCRFLRDWVLLCRYLKVIGYFNADISNRVGTFMQISQRHWLI